MTDETRELAISKIMFIMERFYENELYKFSRRPTLSSMARWAKKNDSNITTTDRRAAFIEKAKNASCHRDRYCALNLTNRNTIEFRIFRSTLNPQTFAATLQLVDSIVKFAKTHTTIEVQQCTFGDIVAECKYAELSAYCTRRGIALNHSNNA